MQRLKYFDGHISRYLLYSTIDFGKYFKNQKLVYVYKIF